MRKPLAKIKTVLSKAGASNPELFDLLSGLQVLTTARLTELSELFAEDDAFPALFLENYRQKHSVLSGADGDSWQAIVEEEKRRLEMDGGNSLR